MTIRPKLPPPVHGVHLDDHLFVSGYFLDIPYAFQVTTVGSLVDAVLVGKLRQGLHALNVVRNHLRFIASFSVHKTMPATFTLHLYNCFRPLRPFRTTLAEPQKSIFNHINENLYKDENINSL